MNCVIKLLIISILGSTMVMSVPAFDPAKAKEMYDYTRPTYCAAAELQKWQCEPCLIHSQMKELQVFYNSSHAGQGYCGYDAQNDVIIVAVRGTVELENWVQDIDFVKTSYQCSGCKVHLGFHKVYEDLANNLLACAYTLSSNHPKSKIYITGHSLGAAVAAFTAIEINANIRPISLFYSFGSPRVGNQAFVDYINKQLSQLYLARITHWKDPFIHLPGTAEGFNHYGNEIFLSDDSSSFKTCGTEDKSCGNQFDLPWKWVIKDHLFYYQSCAGCSSASCDKYKDKTLRSRE